MGASEVNGDVATGAIEGITTAPPTLEVALGTSPAADVLSFAGLTIALLAAILLLVLNREDRKGPSAA